MIEQKANPEYMDIAAKAAMKYVYLPKDVNKKTVNRYYSSLTHACIKATGLDKCGELRAHLIAVQTAKRNQHRKEEHEKSKNNKRHKIRKRSNW